MPGSTHGDGERREFDSDGPAEVCQPLGVLAGTSSAIDDAVDGTAAERRLEHRASHAAEASKPGVSIFGCRRGGEHLLHDCTILRFDPITLS
jgi:hypothetical protein